MTFVAFLKDTTVCEPVHACVLHDRYRNNCTHSVVSNKHIGFSGVARTIYNLMFMFAAIHRIGCIEFMHFMIARVCLCRERVARRRRTVMRIACI